MRCPLLTRKPIGARAGSLDCDALIHDILMFSLDPPSLTGLNIILRQVVLRGVYRNRVPYPEHCNSTTPIAIGIARLRVYMEAAKFIGGLGRASGCSSSGKSLWCTLSCSLHRPHMLKQKLQSMQQLVRIRNANMQTYFDVLPPPLESIARREKFWGD